LVELGACADESTLGLIAKWR